MLVLGKTYTISKSAIVPTTVQSDQELVEANSKLARDQCDRGRDRSAVRWRAPEAAVVRAGRSGSP